MPQDNANRARLSSYLLDTTLESRRHDAAEAVEGEGGQAGGPQTGPAREVPEEGQEHGKGEGAEGVEAEGRAPMAFGQLKHRPREAAQRTGTAGEPVKGAELERRVDRWSETPKRPEEERDRRNAHREPPGPKAGQSAATVRWSKPTTSR